MLDTLPTYVDERRLFGRHGFLGLDWHCRLMLGEQPHGGRALEIGAGDGLMSLWMLHAGANAVTSLEPEAAGSTAGVAARAASHRQALGLTDEEWEYRPDTFQDFSPDKRYRVVLSQNSVNHLDEDACMRLLEDPAARRRYVELFRKVYELLEPGGRFVVTDVARENYWARLGRPSPWAPEIEWDKHQEPETWAEVLREAGFEVGPDDVHWVFPFYRARRAQPVLDNRLAARCLSSNFVIRARRRAADS